ncbi:MAG: hypothetical protein UFG06_02715 [Lachnospiraceae bacterium]|nr:hypothetical protein [Lachnospiraceae bacterium]
MRIVYRQLQEIPFEKWMQEIELERHTDENEGALGHPLPKRYRMFSGDEHSQTRVHIRTYDDFEHYGELFEAFMEDETGQKDEVVRHNFYNWEREELYFIDDPIDVEALKAELAEIQGEKKG